MSCILSSKARIYYEPYKEVSEARVEYQYTGEAKQTITTSNPPISFTTTQTDPQPAQCPVNYYLKYRYYYNADGTNVSGLFNSSSFSGGISGVRIRLYGNGRDDMFNSDDVLTSFQYDRVDLYLDYPDGSEIKLLSSNANTYGMRVEGYYRYDGLADDCGTGGCKFEVSDSTGIIYTETREECPTAQTFDVECTLQDEQYFDIEKLPFVQYIRFEISPSNDSQIDFYLKQTLSSYGDDIEWSIKSISSDDNCPPPEFNIECNPDDKCPPETCECELNDGTLCCIDPNTGVVVKNG